MFDIIVHSFLHSLSILPFLFVSYLLIEIIEQKVPQHLIPKILEYGKAGPAAGGLLGIIPQCSFSAMAATFYSGGLITIGTLISIFLSTSDELIPLLISYSIPTKTVIFILITKLLFSVFAGLMIDNVCRKIHTHRGVHIDELCANEHCECGTSIICSTGIHTLKIFSFIFIVSTGLEFIFHYVDLVNLISILQLSPILAHVLSLCIGIIPNCASSVALTELYVNNVITIAPLITGLFVNSGIGMLTLFRTNKNIKENLKILLMRKNAKKNNMLVKLKFANRKKTSEKK